MARTCADPSPSRSAETDSAASDPTESIVLEAARLYPSSFLISHLTPFVSPLCTLIVVFRFFAVPRSRLYVGFRVTSHLQIRAAKLTNRLDKTRADKQDINRHFR